ncbi:MAG: SUMF1/EgtB/PvdO family nonheme iron enzyme [Ardenticatenaceae bacterium]|nr:SUMF1/EgtB/PvdO family nonheme iron enzyme [Ardenticatenaceae bacterium]
MDELRVLCFDLGLEYEELPGSTRTTKMHSLIEYLFRRVEMRKLLAEVNEQRPSVAWPSFPSKSSISEPGLLNQDQSRNFVHERSSLEMIFIPPGVFLFGEEKQPAFLPGYWIAKTPVTNAHYARFVQDSGHEPPKHWKNGISPPKLALHPVVWVSWNDAALFALWAGLDLPTEQQWEKAARGNDGREYPWGNEWKPYCNTEEAGYGTTTPVGYYSPFGDSPFGCEDMAGNVWEWTDSWWDKEKEWRVLRGGAWFFNYWSARVNLRYMYDPYFRFYGFGFRVVLSTMPTQ